MLVQHDPDRSYFATDDPLYNATCTMEPPVRLPEWDSKLAASNLDQTEWFILLGLRSTLNNLVQTGLMDSVGMQQMDVQNFCTKLYENSTVIVRHAVDSLRKDYCVDVSNTAPTK